MKKYLFLFILLSIFFCQTAMADFYKWVDENGETRITDYPPPQDKAAKDVQIHKSDLPNPETKDDASKDKPKKPDIILYTKNNCPDCDKARDFLKSKDVTLTEYNIDENEKAAAKRKEIDDSTDVPLAIINRNQVHGFLESIYNKLLKSVP